MGNAIPSPEKFSPVTMCSFFQESESLKQHISSVQRVCGKAFCSFITIIINTNNYVGFVDKCSNFDPLHCKNKEKKLQ